MISTDELPVNVPVLISGIVCEEEVSKIIERFLAISDDIELGAQEGIELSARYAEKYLAEHANNGSGLNPVNAMLMAAARLDWLLKQGRTSISGLFSEEEILTLLDCNQGDLFHPERVSRMAIELCGHLDIDPSKYKLSRLAPLLDKVGGLGVLENMALADALEQCWHVGLKHQEKSLPEFLSTLGIDLA